MYPDMHQITCRTCGIVHERRGRQWLSPALDSHRDTRYMMLNRNERVNALNAGEDPARSASLGA